MRARSQQGLMLKSRSLTEPQALFRHGVRSVSAYSRVLFIRMALQKPASLERTTVPDQAYRLSRNEAPPILEASLFGFWSEQDRENFTAALMGEIEAFRQRDRSFGLLFDLREFGVQSAANIDAMITASSPGTEHKRAPAAVVVDRALMKLQASRVLLGPKRMFETREEAIKWLMNQLEDSRGPDDREFYHPTGKVAPTARK